MVNERASSLSAAPRQSVVNRVLVTGDFALRLLEGDVAPTDFLVQEILNKLLLYARK
jgi:hypothetical protein